MRVKLRTKIKWVNRAYKNSTENGRQFLHGWGGRIRTIWWHDVDRRWAPAHAIRHRGRMGLHVKQLPDGDDRLTWFKP